MGTTFEAAALEPALQRWAVVLQLSAPELNALDAQLGDGDLGATLEKCGRNVRTALAALPPPATPAAIFKTCAQACAKASGSSFGTLLALAFATAAKVVGDRTALDRPALVDLLGAIVTAIAARGGAALGDKTMLDSLNAIRLALDAAADEDDLAAAARVAAQRVLDAMRDQPNRIGRARMFADKSVGLDDPGMVAVLRMTEAL